MIPNPLVFGRAAKLRADRRAPGGTPAPSSSSCCLCRSVWN